METVSLAKFLTFQNGPPANKNIYTHSSYYFEAALGYGKWVNFKDHANFLKLLNFL